MRKAYRHERRYGRRGGFSLTELLVVIGIIVLLVGLLLVALGTVRGKARRSQTETTLRSFAQASETFQTEQGFYPGVIPEDVLAQNPGVLTTTENAILHLMGGYRVRPPDVPNSSQTALDYDAFNGVELTFDDNGADWRLKFNRDLIGEGPVIESRPFAPYFTPSGREIGIAEGQVNEPSDPRPDLIDSWGQPVLYARRLRSIGPLVGDVDESQYTLVGMEAYVESTALGRLGANQLVSGSNPRGSILSSGSPLSGSGLCGITKRECNLWRLIEHPALLGEARGAFALFSAGEDGIFYSAGDGPGDSANLVYDLYQDDPPIAPAVLDDYDDVRVFGGG